MRPAIQPLWRQRPCWPEPCAGPTPAMSIRARKPTVNNPGPRHGSADGGRRSGTNSSGQREFPGVMFAPTGLRQADPPTGPRTYGSAVPFPAGGLEELSAASIDHRIVRERVRCDDRHWGQAHLTRRIPVRARPDSELSGADPMPSLHRERQAVKSLVGTQTTLRRLRNLAPMTTDGSRPSVGIRIPALA